MYNGYRLKIDGTIFPNRYIANGSYSAVNQKRVVEIWKDANQVEHEVTTGTTKAIITFQIIEHDSSTHGALVAFFQGNDHTIEFYDDRTDSYKTASCRLSDLKFSHRNTYGNALQYKPTSVIFTEN